MTKYLVAISTAIFLSTAFSVGAEFTGTQRGHLGGGGRVVFESTDANAGAKAMINGEADWVTISNRSSQNLGTGYYRISVSWTYATNWVANGVTTDRTTTITAGGQTETLTQLGIDNTMS